MKHIVKQQEPEAFANWKALANDDWQPTYDTLSGETRRVVKTALMAEQGHICCYCERRLTEEDSQIEHFRPQSDPAVDPLDFGNLLCSCQNQNKKGEPRHCGNLKEDWFDRCLIVSPLDPECENRFAFTGNGEIKSLPDHDLAASETIKKLELDIAKLNALRAKAIESFLDDHLSHHEMQAFVTGYLNRDESGQFGEFWTTIRYQFGGLYPRMNPYIARYKALKGIESQRNVINELDDYERDILYPLATEQLAIDLDDGVKAKYPKFGATLKMIVGLEASDE